MTGSRAIGSAGNLGTCCDDDSAGETNREVSGSPRRSPSGEPVGAVAWCAMNDGWLLGLWEPELPVFCGHSARKCESLRQMLHVILWPSAPMGFRRRPFPFPLERFPLDERFPDLPPPLKKVRSNSSSVSSSMKWKRDFPFPFDFPFPLTRRRMNRRTARTGLPVCLLQAALAF